MWIFDLDNDSLQIHEKDRSRRIPLCKLRQGPVSSTDLEPYHPPALARYHKIGEYLSEPTWDPEYDASEQQIAIIGRILEDFSHQWRHVLRSRYNDSTFRRLARAILRIATLDFEITEVASFRSAIPGSLVALRDLPRWEPFGNRIVHLGRIPIVLCQHLTHSISAIRNDFGPHGAHYRSKSTPHVAGDSVTYLVLSVREVFMYKAYFDGFHNPPIYTKPEPLLDGIGVPSRRAIEYLLMAAPCRSPATRIHNLPVELQDMVLKEVSAGPVEAARIGCMLALGSTFRWETGDHTISRQDTFASRSSSSPVESQIWFDGCFSGLAYQ